MNKTGSILIAIAAIILLAFKYEDLIASPDTIDIVQTLFYILVIFYALYQLKTK